MSDEEAMLSAHNDWYAVVWCAKEALYKMAGREGVDFKRDIIIRRAQMQDASWKLSAELFGTESVTLDGSLIDDNHILVYTI
jgi:phosphopantetheinyl transferase (holo-ACP synthase)